MGDHVGITMRVRSWVGACVAVTDDEDLKDTLKRSQQVLRVAETTTELTGSLQDAAKVFRNARQGLSKVSETLDTVEGVCLDARAILQIRDAMKVLNQDGSIQRDPRAAAEAFGNLFTGFGRLARRLPAPASMYAGLLEACGGDFFNSMRKKLDPGERWKSIFDQIDH